MLPFQVIGVSKSAEMDAADHHTPDFYIDDSVLDRGVKALTAMTLHYMRTRPAARAAGP